MRYFASTNSDLDALNAHPGIGVMVGPPVSGLGSITAGRAWTSDCGAVSKYGFDEDLYFAQLQRLEPWAATCHFLVVPDVMSFRMPKPR